MNLSSPNLTKDKLSGKIINKIVNYNNPNKSKVITNKINNPSRRISRVLSLEQGPS